MLPAQGVSPGSVCASGNSCSSALSLDDLGLIAGLGRLGVLVPEPRLERSLDRGLRVAALVGDAADCVLLLEREAGRQRTEPSSGPREGGPEGGCVVVCGDVACEFEGVPTDGAVCGVDQVVELLDPVFSNENCIFSSKSGSTRGR